MVSGRLVNRDSASVVSPRASARYASAEAAPYWSHGRTSVGFWAMSDLRRVANAANDTVSRLAAHQGTVNGKSYPATDTVHLRGGETVKFRFIGANNNLIHPMHMHGGPFTVVARDGVTLAPGARFEADVINLGPGQRYYDVIWPAREPGKWILHCHLPHHTLNNNVEEQGAGGLTVLVVVQGP